MNILTEAKRFSPSWRRSSGGALSKKAFHKETGEAVRRVLPQRQLTACRVNDDQPILRDDVTPTVSVSQVLPPKFVLVTQSSRGIDLAIFDR